MTLMGIIQGLHADLKVAALRLEQEQQTTERLRGALEEIRDGRQTWTLTDEAALELCPRIASRALAALNQDKPND